MCPFCRKKSFDLLTPLFRRVLAMDKLTIDNITSEIFDTLIKKYESLLEDISNDENTCLICRCHSFSCDELLKFPQFYYNGKRSTCSICIYDCKDDEVGEIICDCGTKLFFVTTDQITQQKIKSIHCYNCKKKCDIPKNEF